VSIDCARESNQRICLRPAQARADLDRAKHTAGNIEKLEATYEQANRVSETIESGNAVHNVEYADAMMTLAGRKLKSVIDQAQP
jgi:hypothetical protein